MRFEWVPNPTRPGLRDVRLLRYTGRVRDPINGWTEGQNVSRYGVHGRVRSISLTSQEDILGPYPIPNFRECSGDPTVPCPVEYLRNHTLVQVGFFFRIRHNMDDSPFRPGSLLSTVSIRRSCHGGRTRSTSHYILLFMNSPVPSD